MSVWEVLLFIISLSYVFWFALRRAYSSKLTKLAAVAIVCVAGLHFVIDGGRWQMVPTYVMAVMILAAASIQLLKRKQNHPAKKRRRIITISLCLSTLIFAVIAIVPPVFVPRFHLPQPTGPYPIGTSYHHLMDPDREEIFTEEPNDRRELMIQLWYPAKRSSTIETSHYWPFVDYLNPGGTKWLLSYLKQVPTHAVIRAEISSEQSRYPVILLSHGLGMGVLGSSSYTALAEELASRGYIVVGINHSYLSMVTAFPDGRSAWFNSRSVLPGLQRSEAAVFDRIVSCQAQDASFVLRELTKWSESDPQHMAAGRLDLSRLAMIGHSIGAQSLVETLLTDTGGELKAGISLDGFPLNSVTAAGALKQPFLYIGADPDIAGYTPEDQSKLLEMKRKLMKTGDIELTIRGAVHNSFGDTFYMLPWTSRMIGAELGANRAQRMTADAVDAFLQITLYGKSADLLDKSMAKYDEAVIKRFER